MKKITTIIALTLISNFLYSQTYLVYGQECISQDTSVSTVEYYVEQIGNVFYTKDLADDKIDKRREIRISENNEKEHCFYIYFAGVYCRLHYTRITLKFLKNE